MSATWNCRAWRMWCSCARPMRMRKLSGSTRLRPRAMPGVIAVVTGAELAAVITPWVGVLIAYEGPQIGAPACDRDRSRLLAGRSRRRRRSRPAARSRRTPAELVAVDYEELEAVTDMRTALDPQTPGDSCLARRQSCIRAQSRCRRGRCGVRGFRRGRGSGIRVRPAHRRDAGAARGGRRLERRRGAADDLPRHAGAAHGAEHRGTSSGPRGVAGSRGLQGRRRLLRHQGSRLCRRNGHLCVVEIAAPADQIRRRPGRKFQYRYPRPRPSLQGPDRRQARRHHHGVRDRRSHRHRSVFDVPAHQRHRGQPGRQPRRRSVHDARTTARAPASCSRTRT